MSDDLEKESAAYVGPTGFAWHCGCGEVNLKSADKCRSCGRSKTEGLDLYEANQRLHNSSRIAGQTTTTVQEEAGAKSTDCPGAGVQGAQEETKEEVQLTASQTILRKVFGILLLGTFGLVIVTHLLALMTLELTGTDLWELPATLTISGGLALCGYALLRNRPKFAMEAAGYGLGCAGVYLFTIVVVFLTQPQMIPLLGSLALNGGEGLALVVIGVVLVWLASGRKMKILRPAYLPVIVALIAIGLISAPVVTSMTPAYVLQDFLNAWEKGDEDAMNSRMITRNQLVLAMKGGKLPKLRGTIGETEWHGNQLAHVVVTMSDEAEEPFRGEVVKFWLEHEGNFAWKVDLDRSYIEGSRPWD